jgi:hypothetical protein
LLTPLPSYNAELYGARTAVAARRRGAIMPHAVSAPRDA